MKKLFVYGTLKRGHGNWDWALNNEHSNFIGEAVLKGNYTMVSLGGFPGVIPSDNKSEIHGEVFEVEDNVYRDIEHLEGYPHFYDKMEVDTEHGKAEMYILGEKYLNNKVVESGNW